MGIRSDKQKRVFKNAGLATLALASSSLSTISPAHAESTVRYVSTYHARQQIAHELKKISAVAELSFKTLKQNFVETASPSPELYQSQASPEGLFGPVPDALTGNFTPEPEYYLTSQNSSAHSDEEFLKSLEPSPEAHASALMGPKKFGDFIDSVKAGLMDIKFINDANAALVFFCAVFDGGGIDPDTGCCLDGNGGLVGDGGPDCTIAPDDPDATPNPSSTPNPANDPEATPEANPDSIPGVLPSVECVAVIGEPLPPGCPEGVAPDASPDYNPGPSAPSPYNPDYTPDYNPEPYNPDYPNPYDPGPSPYNPDYTPDYNPDYPNPYDPGPYDPDYNPDYNPDYPNPYDPGPYDPDYNPDYPEPYDPGPTPYDPDSPDYNPDYPEPYDPGPYDPDYPEPYDPDYPEPYDPDYPEPYDPDYPEPYYPDPDYPEPYYPDPEYPEPYDPDSPDYPEGPEATPEPDPCNVIWLPDPYPSTPGIEWPPNELFEASPQDNRYRDLCVNTPDIFTSSFEPDNGAFADPEGIRPDGFSDTFDAAGDISGAKPPVEQCVPVLTTPLNPLVKNYDPTYSDQPGTYGYDFSANTAFRYFVNYQDLYDYKDPVTQGVPQLIKGHSDKFREETIMVGGISNCLNTMRMKEWLEDDKEDNLTALVHFRRAQAYNCAAQFIHGRSLRPWFLYEPVGSPHALIAHSVVVPPKYCQPLVDGDEAKEIDKGDLEEYKAGFARVVHASGPYKALWNENEYYVSDYTTQAKHLIYGDILVHRGEGVGYGTYDSEYNYPVIPDPNPDELMMDEVVTNIACLVPGEPPIPSIDVPEYVQGFNVASVEDLFEDDIQHTRIPGTEPGMHAALELAQAILVDWPFPECPPPAPQPSPEPQPEPECAEPNFYEPYGDSPGAQIREKYYCPNTESIKDPTHPFSPRWDIVTYRGQSIPYNRNASGIVGTDRNWSVLTSEKMKVFRDNNGMCEFVYEGYNYNGYNDPEGPWTEDPNKKLSEPIVQCGIVPVDVLKFRYQSFHKCMHSRIAQNKDAWYQYVQEYGSPSGFTPPCSTKYYQDDPYPGSCISDISIQQCCSIITKPVVPMNHLKIRTIDGLLKESSLEDIQDIVENTDGLVISGAEPDSPEYVTAFVEPPSSSPFNPWLIPYPQHLEAVKELAEKRNGQANNLSVPIEYRFDHWFRSYTDPGDEDAGREPGFVGVHMPYMRWWDTGATAGMKRKYGSFVNTLGGYDVLVGVGREERSDIQAEEQEKYAEDIAIPEGTPQYDYMTAAEGRQAGNLGGWGELLLHQMYTIRLHNFNCIGRYEKLFKDGDASNFVHYAGGGSYTSRANEDWNWPLSWMGYAQGGGITPTPSITIGLDEAQVGDIAIFTFDGVRTPMFIEGLIFPPEFEQKIRDLVNTNLFSPLYGNPTADDAPGGNILWYNTDTSTWQIRTKSSVTYHEPSDTWNVNGDPIEEASPIAIRARALNEGKFPSAAGVTMQWGVGPQRVIFRNEVPDSYKIEKGSSGTDEKFIGAKVPYREYDENGNEKGDILKWQPSCTDADYTVCILPRKWRDWREVEIYRPVRDNSNICSLPNALLQKPSEDNLYPTSLFSKCVADGMSPPPQFRSGYGKEVKKGAMSGDVNKTFYCGPWWNSCTAIKYGTSLDPVPKPIDR